MTPGPQVPASMQPLGGSAVTGEWSAVADQLQPLISLSLAAGGGKELGSLFQTEKGFQDCI